MVRVWCNTKFGKCFTNSNCIQNTLYYAWKYLLLPVCFSGVRCYSRCTEQQWKSNICFEFTPGLNPAKVSFLSLSRCVQRKDRWICNQPLRGSEFWKCPSLEGSCLNHWETERIRAALWGTLCFCVSYREISNHGTRHRVSQFPPNTGACLTVSPCSAGWTQDFCSANL